MAEDTATSPDIIASFSILVFLILLGFTISIAYILERTKFKYLHETFLSILMGACIGAIIKYSNAPSLKNVLTFDTEFFFFLLLPPIVFNAGYDLKRRNFFRNFGSILAFAFIGTTVSTFAVGFLMYGVIAAGWVHVNLDVIDCLVFGALISATDPVTVLAIFHSLHVEPKLFALVFGESILNDAVAIVLFETLQVFHSNPITAGSILLGVANFVGIFAGSFLIGASIGCFSALVFKHTKLCENPMLESGVFVIFAYTSYLFAQGVGASGIVAMLFAGIFMAHYAMANLSEKSQQTTKYMFQLLAFLAENFIFTYLGITIFTKDGYLYQPLLIFLVLIIIVIARAIHVFPISLLINLFAKRAEDKLPFNLQFMTFWSGLRGAIAFALSMQIWWDAGPLLVTTTLMIVVITVALFGTPTSVMLVKLGVRVGVEDDEEDHHATLTSSSVETRGQAPVTRADRLHWFVSFDRKYLKPFFTRARPFVALNEQIDRDETEEHNEMDDLNPQVKSADE